METIDTSTRKRSLLQRVIDFYSISSPNYDSTTPKERFYRIRLATFISATCGYALYYVCRLSMNIVRKPIVENGLFTETELGIIGSCLFFVYAVGKMANGFLADRCNARRFMATGLLLTAIVNLLLGFSNMFIVLLFCGVSTAGFSQWVHLRVSYRSTAGMTTKTAVPITEYGARATT